MALAPQCSSRLFALARTWKQHKCPSTEEWMRKIHTHNGILLGHKKEQNWIIYRDVNGPRIYDTKWNKSEKEKQISHISTETSREWEINSARPVHEDLGIYCLAGAGSACFSISCLGQGHKPVFIGLSVPMHTRAASARWVGPLLKVCS